MVFDPVGKTKKQTNAFSQFTNNNARTQSPHHTSQHHNITTSQHHNITTPITHHPSQHHPST